MEPKIEGTSELSLRNIRDYWGRVVYRRLNLDRKKNLYRRIFLSFTREFIMVIREDTFRQACAILT